MRFGTLPEECDWEVPDTKSSKNLDDPYKWSLETVAVLRAGDFSSIHMDELINEMSSIASGLRREMMSLLRDILEALLILAYANADKEEAERQLVHAHGQLQLLLDSAPTLREVMTEVIDKAYQRANDNVTEDYGMPCPITVHSRWNKSWKTRMTALWPKASWHEDV
jgi:hypothetical protein